MYKESIHPALFGLSVGLSVKNPLEIPGYGVISSTPDDLARFGQKDGIEFDKDPEGILKSANEFAGGSRSAFCPINDPAWKLREVPRRLFDRQHSELSASIAKETDQVLLGITKDNGQLTTEVLDFAREKVLRISEKLMFGVDLTEEKAAVISSAYKRFNSWCAVNALLKQIPESGRYPKMSYVSIFNNDEGGEISEKDARGSMARMASLVFANQHKKFNDALVTIADHSEEIWLQLSRTQPSTFEEYQTKASELGLTERDIVLELTNVIGGAISSPSSFLAFSLSVYGRLPADEQQKIKTDSKYRHLYYMEVQRLYQPLPWLMRDSVVDNEVGSTQKGAAFTFYTFDYNRNPKVWGEDANSYRPSRFEDDTRLYSKLIFFGKGRRRCPAGKFGEGVAVQCFEKLISEYGIEAKGPLKVGLSETIYPKGKIKIRK
jgi:cytochrome P450